MAFYDSVAVIAGRSIVTIEPLPEKKKETEETVIIKQPKKNITWFAGSNPDEDEEYKNIDEIEQTMNETNLGKSKEMKTFNTKQEKINTYNDNISKLEDVLDGKPFLSTEINQNKYIINNYMKQENKVVEPAQAFETYRSNAEHKNITSENSKSTFENKEKEKEDFECEKKNDEEEEMKKNKKIVNITSNELLNTEINENNPKPETSSQQLLTTGSDESITLRKKSLKERRLSKCLSLNLDMKLEIPVIRQSSMPKFFLDTPDEHQQESSLIRSTSMVLSSPMKPPNEFNLDLKSIVEIEKERINSSNNKLVTVKKENSISGITKLVHIKHKFKKPHSFKRHASTNNLPNSINHI